MKWPKSQCRKILFPMLVTNLMLLSLGFNCYASHISSINNSIYNSINNSIYNSTNNSMNSSMNNRELLKNVTQMTEEGQKIFRYDTFGDEAFWGDTLHLHQAIQGSKFGGVGEGVSPKTALSVGLKVDMEALPSSLVNDIKAGKVDLNDPATTLALLKLNAVIGVTGFFDKEGSKLTSIGIQCALCHSTVDNAFSYGIGHRLDGIANHDLNVGAIVSLSPNLKVIADFIGVSEKTAKTVLAAWGPGKYDAELLLDGKGFNPVQITNGKITGTNVSGATLIPNALGLGGHSQHTWTGAWGGITYWNAFVANLQMHGIGNFYDPRLDNAIKYPIAAKHRSGHIKVSANQDLITSKLPALHFYQLGIPAPIPVPGKDFDEAAAKRGWALFNGKAQCQRCHNGPIFTEAGWDLHSSSAVGVDNFQAARGPDGVLKTANLRGVFVRENALYMDPKNKGGFYHDGRFKTLKEVVNHYNELYKLALANSEMNDLVEYLKSN